MWATLARSDRLARRNTSRPSNRCRRVSRGAPGRLRSHAAARWRRSEPHCGCLLPSVAVRGVVPEFCCRPRRLARRRRREDPMTTAKRGSIPSVLHIPLFVASWLAIEYLFVGPLTFAYVLLFAGGFVLWWFTARKATIDADKVIIPYLVSVILFIAHVYEEYKAHLLGFPDIVQGAPFPISFEMMLTFAASSAPILWLLGAVLMLKRQPLGFFIASTFLFGMMFIEPTHFIAPFSQGAG